MMDPPPASEPSLSLLGVTIRRSAVLGRFFLVYATVLSVFLGVVFAVTPGSAFSAYPYLVPIFGVTGSLGGLLVFTSDRTKGTLEYFLAYGISSRRLFASILLTTLALVTIVTGVGVGAGLGLYLARGKTLTGTFSLSLLLYAVPMSYATASFSTVIGMYWSALSSPRAGMNSPVGLAPLIGVLPPTMVLVAVSALAAAGVITTSSGYLAVAVAAMGVVAAVTLVLLASVGRLLRNERLLSSA